MVVALHIIFITWFACDIVLLISTTLTFINKDADLRRPAPKEPVCSDTTPPALKCSSHYQTADSPSKTWGTKEPPLTGPAQERMVVMAKELRGVNSKNTVFLFFF